MGPGTGTKLRTTNLKKRIADLEAEVAFWIHQNESIQNHIEYWYNQTIKNEKIVLGLNRAIYCLKVYRHAEQSGNNVPASLREEAGKICKER